MGDQPDETGTTVEVGAFDTIPPVRLDLAPRRAALQRELTAIEERLVMLRAQAAEDPDHDSEGLRELTTYAASELRRIADRYDEEG